MALASTSPSTTSWITTRTSKPLRPVSNPPNPWRQAAPGGFEVDWLGEPPEAALEVFEEDAKSILVRNDSPDVPFTWSVNPYRGCQHACAYCYARTGHQYLGMGAGTDFDSKIVVKRNAEALLRSALARGKTKVPGGGVDWIALSGVTDPYQPLEASYGLTRGCLEACAEFRQPVGLITKSALVRRDLDLIARVHERSAASVFLSIPFADPVAARSIEPWAATPDRRFDALRSLSAKGIPTGVSLSPMIPGLNDHAIPEILARAAEAGAQSAFMILLRLPGEVAPVFEERLRNAFPERADKVMAQLAQSRAAQPSRSAFGARMSGTGPRWKTALDLFRLHCRKHGLRMDEGTPVRTWSPASVRSEAHGPVSARQPDLFES